MSSAFSELLAFRKQWRIFHNQQDRENADRLFAHVETALNEAIPRTLPAHLTRELDAYGREWEKAIARAAVREGHSVYKTLLEIPVDHVNEFHAWIETTFATEKDDKPIGAPLFFTTLENSTVMDGKWDAVFYFVLRSDHSPDGLHFEKAPSLKAAKLHFERVV